MRGERHSKNKGSRFERLICKMLSRWVTRGARDDVFWRSAMSGGRATFQRKMSRSVPGRMRLVEKHTQEGDISAIHPAGAPLLGSVVIECKCYRELRLDQLAYNVRGTFLGIWLDLQRRAEESRRHPMLIAKENNRPILVGIDTHILNMLNSYRPTDGMEDLRPRLTVPTYDLCLLPLDTLIAETDPTRAGLA